MFKKIFITTLVSGLILTGTSIYPSNVYAENSDQGYDTSIDTASPSDSGYLDNQDENTVSDIELETIEEETYQTDDIDVEARLQEVYNECVNGTTNDLERFTAFAKWIANNTDYNASYTSYTSMLKHNAGDCWASTALIVKLCDMAGITAATHLDNQFGEGVGHRNAIAKIDDTYYVADAGFTGKKPREYLVYELPYGVETMYIDNETVAVVNYGGLDSEVIIPETVKGKTVTRFADDNFYMFSSDAIETVILPDTVTSLDRTAFYHASNLKKVYIPKSVTKIHSESFYNTVKYVINGAVSDCSITDVYYSGTEEQWNAIENIESVPSNVRIHFNRSSEYAHEYDSTFSLDPETNDWIETGTCKYCGHEATLVHDDTVYDLVKAKVDGVTSYYKSTNGKYDPTFNGIARHETGWYCVKNGRVDKSVNAVKNLTLDSKKAWYVIKNGKVLLDYTGFAKVGSSWMYYTNGYVDKSINADHYGSFCGVIDGVKGWYVVKKGKAYPDYNGFALVGSSWMYYKNGKVDKSFTGTKNVTINGVKKWYYIEKGKAILNYYGFAKVGTSWMYYWNGSIDKTYTDLCYGEINGESNVYLVVNGKYQSNYTGYYELNGYRYYFVNGILQ